MKLIKNIYFNLYFIVLTLYLIFDKGIAYSFLVEFTWFIGIILVFINRKNILFILNSKTKLIYFFILVANIYLLVGIKNYSFINVIKDSFVFNYAFFTIILFLFTDDVEKIWIKLEKIYKWYPIVPLLSFSIFNLFPSLDSVKIFGDVTIMNHKHSDMSIHLLISTIFFINNQSNGINKYQYIIILLIIFDFLMIASYSRSGIISFLISIMCFLYFNKEKVIDTNLKRFFKLVVIGFVIIVPIYANIQIQENFQGRTVGFDQLKNNFMSIVASNEDVPATLEDNKIWRLVWWGKIINYSFTPEYFFTGRGLGMSLVKTDGIDADEDLRSPHNFHLTIMARFGVILFVLWGSFLLVIFKDYFKKKLTGKRFLIVSILLAFVINASFDVFLEGPMGAFPFWTFIGILIIEEYHYKPKEIPV
jgi:hypothetical protein